MNRRGFVRSMSMTGLLPAISPFTAGPSEGAITGRTRIDLNGVWQRWLEGTPFDSVTVPSSLRPMGFYRLRRNFVLPRLAHGERIFVRFEAISYFARVFVNGTEIGTMGPYVPYEFEFTSLAREKNNQIEVAIADLHPGPDGAGAAEIELGANLHGWEAYGGIIRDAFVEVRPAHFISNARFAYSPAKDFQSVECRPRLYISALHSTRAKVTATLAFGHSEVARAENTLDLIPGENPVDLSFALNAPALWSPEQPNLYDLSMRLETDGGVDETSCRTGFRDVRIRGNQFELNGHRVVLKGVNRHDMWREQGFTLTRAQQEQDMRMIKALGANYVRLVHYPHDRHIVELADELGLLVSEEPGYWQVDFRKASRAIVDVGLTIMERTIRRDWNSPSVFAWLLGNESQLTVDYLREGKALCRRLDPIGRLVSFANYMRRDEQKPIFEQAEMDFFDQHPYTFDLNEFDREAEVLGQGKPLIFSEWGGKAIGQSQVIMQGQVDKLLEMVESGKLAGHAFWSWQDMRQYTRIDPEMRDGVLESGVVTESRQPRDQVYMELARLFNGGQHTALPENARLAIIPLRETPWSPQSRIEPIDLQSVAECPEGRHAWTAFEKHMAEYWSTSDECRMGRDQWKRTGGRFDLWTEREIEILGKRFLFPVVDGRVRPLVVSADTPEIRIPVGVKCSRLHLLGQVTLPTGYPLGGISGEIAGAYLIRYRNGKSNEVLLRHGIEVARANLIFGASRINAAATRAQRALHYSKDDAREQYQVLLLSLSATEGLVESLSLKIAAGAQPLALFAIGAERVAD